MNKLQISRKQLENAKFLIKNLDVECCGTLLPEEKNKLQIFLQKVGEKSSCFYTEYGKIVWHTHSKVSKCYPSAEDFLLPVKNYPSISVIFTVWGIWQINCSVKHKLAEQIKKDWLKSLQKHCDNIYFNTEKGRVKKLTEQQKKFIQTEIKNIVSVMGEKFKDYNCFFTSWQDIEQDYIIH